MKEHPEASLLVLGAIAPGDRVQWTIEVKILEGHLPLGIDGQMTKARIVFEFLKELLAHHSEAVSTSLGRARIKLEHTHIRIVQSLRNLHFEPDKSAD